MIWKSVRYICIFLICQIKISKEIFILPTDQSFSYDPLIEQLIKLEQP